MQKTTNKPQGEALLYTVDHLIKIGYWDGYYWWYEGQYHAEEEVEEWLPLSKVMEVMKWPECLES